MFGLLQSSQDHRESKERADIVMLNISSHRSFENLETDDFHFP